MQEKGKYKFKVTISILSILLAVSLLLLAGTIVYKHFSVSKPVSVTVPENVITPEKQTTASIHNAGIQTLALNSSAAGSYDSANVVALAAQPVAATTASSNSTNTAATVLSLYNRQPSDNTPFMVKNMFPGDSETKYFCVHVSHKSDVTLRFHADIQPGYEKLAEVMKCRVILSESGEVLYEGLMRDMPESLNHALNTQESRTSEVYYEVTAYLDTSVGNGYMDKNLVADFDWWVEETENLDSPKTGDNSAIYLWISLAAVSLAFLILLWRKRGKEAAANEE